MRKVCRFTLKLLLWLSAFYTVGSLLTSAMDDEGPVSMQEFDAPGVRCFTRLRQFSCIPDLRSPGDADDHADSANHHHRRGDAWTSAFIHMSSSPVASAAGAAHEHPMKSVCGNI